MLLFSFDLSLIVKVLYLSKKLLFSVVLLCNLPGAVLKRSASTKTFSPISRGSLNHFLRLSTFVSNFSVRSLFSLTFIRR